MATNLHIFSFFSGSGFLDLGFELSGYTIDFVNEYYPPFLKAYKYARSKMGIAEPTFGYSSDVNDFLGEKGKELKGYIEEEHKNNALVGFIGGPPCPDFSVAGKQKGREGNNGKLSQSYVTLICKQKPDFFLFENVKGLWQTAKHRAYYEELKEELSKTYYLTDRLCNALEFGAPQDRDRILLFGIKKTVANKLHLKIDSFNWDAYRVNNLIDVKSLDWPEADIFEKDSITTCPSGLPENLTAEYWFRRNDVSNHLNNIDDFRPKTGLVRMQTVNEGDVSKKSYKRIHRWRYSPTVCYGNNEVHLHPYKERRLSVAEALALQSLPKEFCLPPDMTLTDKFKTVGNGVPFLLARGIAMTIQEFFNTEA